MKKQDSKNLVVKITDGVLETMTDFVLWLVYFQADMLINPQGRLVWPHVRAADKKLAEVNYQTIKNVLTNCRSTGLIEKTKRKKKILPQITVAGKKRLTAILPNYKKDRVWNKRVYLITYDIPEIKRTDRDILRQYLRQLGCAMMQQSVWLTPYNPREVLQEFIKERNLHGTIIISDIGHDGSIGDEDIKSLIKRIYKLDKINKRYEQFIKRYQKVKATSFAQINFAFLSIVKNDPQLPFALLPDNWLSEDACDLYNAHMVKAISV